MYNTIRLTLFKSLYFLPELFLMACDFKNNFFCLYFLNKWSFNYRTLQTDYRVQKHLILRDFENSDAKFQTTSSHCSNLQTKAHTLTNYHKLQQTTHKTFNVNPILVPSTTRVQSSNMFYYMDFHPPWYLSRYAQAVLRTEGRRRHYILAL
jgi:hypothetical protein